MILLYLILILLVGSIFAGSGARWSRRAAPVAALVSLILDLIILIWIAVDGMPAGHHEWLIEYKINWIPALGISIHLALDGLSLLLLFLTILIGILSVLISWNEISQKIGFFYVNILWILAGIIGVFLSMDLFLFYFFWELMLVPMYFLINIWGHENRIFAAYKFFLYTQASGLLMFVAIVALYFIHGRSTGVYTFNYIELIGTSMTPLASVLLMSGFLAAFLVKLPVVPLHNWLPDAHTEAPTAGSVILAGLLLKTGAYGIIRFVIPLFPEASAQFAPVAMILGVVGILYGAKLAFAQTDLKRLVAYTSVSHMGFVILGVYAFNTIAMEGVIMQMIAHAISTGALFIIVGQLYERIHTRDIARMGGFWTQMPVMGAMGMVFAMASLGLPGLGNFVAEFLILTGTYKASILFTSLACTGLVAATVYSLRIVQKVFLGSSPGISGLEDLSVREKFVSAILVIVIVYLGLFPGKVINTAEESVNKTLYHIEKTYQVNQNSTMTNP